MRVLVTGHNGYIGSVMVDVLRSAGHEVTGVDTYFFSDCGNGDEDHTPAIRKDIRDVTVSDLAGISRPFAMIPSAISIRAGPSISIITRRAGWRL
jgi:nucleoside-diphosphate-sugar epimerase